MCVITPVRWTSGVSCTKISASKDIAHAPADTLSVALHGTPPMRAWRTIPAIAAGSYLALSEDCGCTATGLVQASTQRTPDCLRYAENPIDKRNSRTHQYGLERTQANS
jgi:hypothetical protein